MTDHLHPTPARLALLAQISNVQVMTDPVADQDVILLFPDAPTQWQDRCEVTAKVRELEAAGWVEPLPGGVDWRVTAYGRAIREVRILDFGHHVIAETGDPDEPRYLGNAVPGPGRTWLATTRDTAAALHTKHAAREELRHLAATVLAADDSTPLDNADLSEVEATH